MQIDLPDDVLQRVKQRAAATVGVSEIDIIRKGLDALDRQELEIVAIQEGIDAMKDGWIQDFEDFDREFREKNGIVPDA